MKSRNFFVLFPILLLLRCTESWPSSMMETEAIKLMEDSLNRGYVENAAKQLWRLKEPTKAIATVVNTSLETVAEELKHINSLVQFIDRAAVEKANIFNESKCVAFASLFHPLMDTLFTGSVTRKSSWYILIYRLLYKMEGIVRSDLTGNCQSEAEYDKYSSDMAELIAVFVTERYACLQHCSHKGWPTASIRDVIRAFSDYERNIWSSEAIEYYTKIYAMSWLTHGWKLKDDLAVREEHSVNMINLAYLLWDDWDSSQNLGKADWIPSEEIYEPLILDFPETISQIFWAPKCAIRSVKSGEYLHVRRDGRESSVVLKKEPVGLERDKNFAWWKPRPFITENPGGLKRVNFELELISGKEKLEHEREYLCVDKGKPVTLCHNSRNNNHNGWAFLPRTIRINNRETKNVFQIIVNGADNKITYALKQIDSPKNSYRSLPKVVLERPLSNDKSYYWELVCD